MSVRCDSNPLPNDSSAAATKPWAWCLAPSRSIANWWRTYLAALKRVGGQGVIDLAGINGYYTFLATTMNAARTAVPVSPAKPLPE